MPTTIVINEIYPNPESGSEWIELKINEPSEQEISLRDYTIFDSYHQIYKFDVEQFSDQLLVVEVSGLNNDQDSVILKDENANILDSFTYTQTQKGLSFARQEENGAFVLSEASRNQPNPQLTPTPTNLLVTPTSSMVSLTQTPTPTATPSPPLPSISPSPIPSPIPSPTPSPVVILSIEPSSITKTEENLPTNIAFLPDNSINYHFYDLNKINLKTNAKDLTEQPTRLVLLGKNFKQTAILNAIIGSLLMILSSLFLIYVKVKSKHI